MTTPAKALRHAVLTLFLGAVLAAAAVAGDGLAAIRERGVLRVGIFFADTQPFYFADQAAGGMAGSDVELARRVAAYLGVDMEITRLGPPYNKLLDGLDEDVIDIVISSTSINPERAAKYDTVIYDHTYFSLLLDLDGLEKSLGRELIEPADLNVPEVKIIAQANTPFVAVMKKHFPDATAVEIDANNNIKMMVAAMERGEAYVTFDRELSFLIYSRQDPAAASRFLLHPMPEIMNSVGMLLKKGSDVTPVVQQFVDQNDEVFELSELIDKYMRF